ncbi:hypothetical protein LG943_24460 [Streptomonospora sp. S1-112]|uniref:Uncharacterized protein n=1 Tax=Streptomonospora mangrovi TaxID=2883123 RepID=A0A9X3NSM7_9ACTN|nr:hypothetical protein [Streptomonospora mangrovi]MDA0567451.1 hypothetical protein [Streptomonospora mangrovi]
MGVFAAVCVGVSALGHGLASGHGLAWPVVAAGAALVFAALWPAARRERGLAALCGWMLWGQAALHVLFSLAAPDAPRHHDAHAHAGAGPAPPCAGCCFGGLLGASAGFGGIGPGTDGEGGGMALAHLAAALASAWWLRRGEAAAFRLAGLVGSLLSTLVALGAAESPVPCAPPRPLPAVGGPARAPAHGLLRHTVVLRGPPPPVPA